MMLLSITSFSCYKEISIENFNQSKWKAGKYSCDGYRMESAEIILKHRDQLLSRNQNEIESLLGKADEHELYARNQKFFHYRLTPPDSCGAYSQLEYLSVRFNAIGRSNEIQKSLREPQ